MGTKVVHSELVSAFAAESGITKKDSKVYVELFLKIVRDAVAQGNDVVLQDIGTLKVKEVAGRMARNPRTGEPAEIPARKVVKFSPNRTLAEEIK